MANVTDEYVDQLPDIYRDIFQAFPDVEPARKAGYGLAIQSLYSALEGKHSLGEIKIACEQMAAGGAVEIRNRIFVHPTELGEEIIAKLIGQAAPVINVPPFIPPGA